MLDLIRFFSSANNLALETQNIVFQCLSVNDPRTNKKLKCDKLIDPDKSRIIVEEKIKKWIDFFEFK